MLNLIQRVETVRVAAHELNHPANAFGLKPWGHIHQYQTSTGQGGLLPKGKHGRQSAH
jgi:hypothetical protein